MSKRLRPGDTVGIVAPCYALSEAVAEPVRRGLAEVGLKARFAPNAFRDTWGYAASIEERASDFNAMLRDPDIAMLLFGGGEVGNELLPYLDYAFAREHPKPMLSYSDGTTILEAFSSLAGCVTHYGQSPRTFANESAFNRRAFRAMFLEDGPAELERASEWRAIRPGRAEGVLTGGYLANYAAMLGGRYLRFDEKTRYILFLEDYESFSAPPVVAKHLAHISQSGLMARVDGVLVGHYASEPRPELDAVLARFADAHRVPLVKNDDFGHGKHNAILPIGRTARLDGDAGTLTLLER